MFKAKASDSGSKNGAGAKQVEAEWIDGMVSGDVEQSGDEDVEQGGTEDTHEMV